MPRKLKDRQVIEIREALRDDKVPVAVLMRKYDRSRLSIYNAAKGVTFTHLNEVCPPVEAIEYRREGQKIVPEDHAIIFERYADGETMQEIADTYDVDVAYISRVISEYRQP